MAFTLAAVGARITAAMYNQHASGVRLYKAATTTARDLLTDMVTGDLCLVAANGITYRYSGSAWKAWSSDWISYTPTATNFTIGTGGSAASVFRYRYEDGLVRVRFRATLGTSGASVGTTPSFTLPVTSVTPPHRISAYDGVGSALDASAVAVANLFMYDNDNSTTVFRLYTVAATVAAGVITATAPWTWAAGDSIQGDFVFEAA